jgi:hypothetical protein
MQRILRSRARRLRSNQALCAAGQLSAPDATGSASTSGIETLAPAFGQALPSLADVRAEYSHEVNAELVYELCATLVREGLGTAETWKKSGGNALAFAQHVMMSAIGTERGDLLQRNVEYHLEVINSAALGAMRNLKAGNWLSPSSVADRGTSGLDQRLMHWKRRLRGWVRRSIGR